MRGLHRRALDVAADQLGQDGGALRMPDQHNPTIAIVVREVVVPCRSDVLVSDAQIERARRARRGKRICMRASSSNQNVNRCLTPELAQATIT